MSVLHRALFIWFAVLVFMILLVLRADNRTQWNWFVVFIPVWIFNCVFLISAFDVSSCKGRTYGKYSDMSMNLRLITSILLIMAFEIMLCLKLEMPSVNLTVAHILSPIWVLLPVLSIHIFLSLISRDLISTYY